MSAITNLELFPNVTPRLPLDRANVALPEFVSADPVTDRVELSRFGRALSEATERSSLSVARIRAIRAEIAEGTFETKTRIEGTAARLLDILW